MLNLVDVLRNNEAIFEGQSVVMTCRSIDKAATEYAHLFVISELENLLQEHSTQAYWPAIIKQRINQLKGNDNG
jgi:hypothetical protein